MTTYLTCYGIGDHLWAVSTWSGCVPARVVITDIGIVGKIDIEDVQGVIEVKYMGSRTGIGSGTLWPEKDCFSSLSVAQRIQARRLAELPPDTLNHAPPPPPPIIERVKMFRRLTYIIEPEDKRIPYYVCGYGNCPSAAQANYHNTSRHFGYTCDKLVIVNQRGKKR